MSNLEFIHNTDGDCSPSNDSQESAVPAPTTATEDPSASDALPQAPIASNRESDDVDNDGVEPEDVASSEVAPSPDGAVVPGAASQVVVSPLSLLPFDWYNGEVYSYPDARDNNVHQVGYYDAPDGRKMIERGTLDNGRSYTDDMRWIERRLYNARLVKRLKMILFVQDEAAADLLNDQLVQNGQSEKMVATTTSGGLGHFRNTPFAAQMRDKVVIVIPDNNPEGARHAEGICRACAPKAVLVKIVDLPGLPAGGGIKDFFGAGRKVTEILSLILDAPKWP